MYLFLQNSFTPATNSILEAGQSIYSKTRHLDLSEKVSQKGTRYEGTGGTRQRRVCMEQSIRELISETAEESSEGNGQRLFRAKPRLI